MKMDSFINADSALRILGEKLSSLSARQASIESSLLRYPNALAPAQVIRLCKEYHLLEDDMETLDILNHDLAQTVLCVSLSTNNDRR